MNETSIYVNDFFRDCRDPVEVGRGVAKMWLESRSRYIDFWGYDDYNKSCLDAFLDVLDRAGLIQEAANITFQFHIAPCGVGELTLYDYNRWWVEDYLNNVKMRERLLGI